MKKIQKNQKYVSSSTQQLQMQLKQINRFSVMVQLLNDSQKYSKSETRNDHEQNYQNLYESIYSPLHQALNMDLTSYQTLKQLVIQNKSLKEKSQSSYFLTKQSKRLISFIDGWKMLQNDQFDEQKLLSFENETLFSKKSLSKQKNKSTKVYEQDQKQKLKNQLKQQNQIRLQGERQLQRIKQQNLRKNLSQKLSEQPALIKEEDLQQNSEQNAEQSNQIQCEIQILENQQTQNSRQDENSINNSNLIQTNNRAEQKSKKIKLTKEVKQSNLTNDNFKFQIDQFKNKKDYSRLQISEIIRPEYQRTQISISENSICSSSHIESLLSDQMQHQKKQKNKMSKNQSKNVQKQKKTIPLLKKQNITTISYNQHVNINKNINKNISKINQKQHAQNYLQQANVERNLQKGFVSEDTDANSRLSFLTNKNFSNNQAQKQSQKIQKQQRSLSPKLQGRKKIVLRVALNQGKVQELKTLKETLQSDKRNIKIQDSKNYKRSELEQQIAQLQAQFRNREANHNNEQFQVSKELKKPLIQKQENENRNKFQEVKQLVPLSNSHKQNKTLKLIKRSSKNTDERQIKIPERNQSQENNNNQKHYSHYPLSNNLSKIQNNSIVLEQQPWQCDELQLQEQLKVIDERIQGRKSVIAQRQTIQKQKINITNYLVNQKELSNKQSTQNYYSQNQHNANLQHDNYIQNYSLENKIKHRRAHTLAQKIQQTNYNENLFQEHTVQQPKVVRLSLEAMAHAKQRNSRISGRSEQDRKSIQKKTSQSKFKSTQNRQNIKKQYVQRNNQNIKNLQKQNNLSYSNLNKQPSCKSILLIEEAQKRGISPSKSVRSINKGNQRRVSPIRQYNYGKNDFKTINTNNKSQQNLRKEYINYQNSIMNPNSDDIITTLPASNQIINGNKRKTSSSPLNTVNKNRNTFNQKPYPLKNLSPIHGNNQNKNRFIAYQFKDFTPKSDSRSLSEALQSQNSKVNYPKYMKNNKINEIYSQKMFYTEQFQGRQIKDHFEYSNCENYNYLCEGDQTGINKNQLKINKQKQKIEVPVKKWNIPSNIRLSHGSNLMGNRNKIMLLSDQIELGQ